MASESSPYFPAEISYLIIEQLVLPDDRPTLLSCSLVCRSWLPVARAVIFESLKVVTTASGRLDAFTLFLARCRDVCPLVRDLTLSCKPEARAEDSNAPDRISWSHLRTVISMLPRLRSLTLDGISIARSTSECLDIDPAARPIIQSLRMMGSQLYDMNLSSALSIVRIFSKVDSLSLGGTWRKVYIRPDPSVSDLSTTTRHVHFDSLGAPMTRYFCQFLGPPRGDSLDSIHYTWNSWGELGAFESFLVSHANNVKHLELEPTAKFWMSGESTVNANLNLWIAFGDAMARCSQLESLCMHALRNDLEHTAHSVLSTLMILSRGPPPALRHITVKIPIYRQSKPDDQDWNVMFHDEDVWKHCDPRLAAIQSLTSVVLELQTSSALDTSAQEECTLAMRRALPEASDEYSDDSTLRRTVQG
ncbi:hypothetical protein C8Q73DRAFT_835209 [Cubamyces lactineus]|nr:hypothetical protein C8Q73DRAFT_835209 [Cubamyces lactineus]